MEESNQSCLKKEFHIKYWKKERQFIKQKLKIDEKVECIFIVLLLKIYIPAEVRN